MDWLKLHTSIRRNHKAQLLPPLLFKHWINLLTLASDRAEWGTLPSDLNVLAYELGATAKTAATTIADLTARGLLDKGDDGVLRPHDWELWQSRKPNADKVAAWRKRKSNQNVTATEVTSELQVVVTNETDIRPKTKDIRHKNIPTVYSEQKKWALAEEWVVRMVTKHSEFIPEEEVRDLIALALDNVNTLKKYPNPERHIDMQYLGTRSKERKEGVSYATTRRNGSVPAVRAADEERKEALRRASGV